MGQSLAYTFTQKLLHWLIAVGFIEMILFGFLMAPLPPSEIKWLYYMLHKSFGTILFLLILWRVLVRLRQGAPAYPLTLSPFHLILSKLSVPALYLCMIMIPLSGIVMSLAGGHGISIFNLITIPGLNPKAESVAGMAHWVHVNSIYLVIVIGSFHIGAAFYHHFILKNNILNRMMPEARNP